MSKVAQCKEKAKSPTASQKGRREDLLKVFPVVLLEIDKKRDSPEMSLDERVEYDLASKVLWQLESDFLAIKEFHDYRIDRFLSEEPILRRRQEYVLGTERISMLSAFLKVPLCDVKDMFKKEGLKVPALLLEIHTQFAREKNPPPNVKQGWCALISS